jgi:hypothetical protein
LHALEYEGCGRNPSRLAWISPNDAAIPESRYDSKADRRLPGRIVYSEDDMETRLTIAYRGSRHALTGTAIMEQAFGGGER